MDKNILNTKNDFYFNKTTNKIYSESTHHYHSSFEIYYLEDGECHYFIDNATYTVIPGDIVLIPPGIIHRTNYRNNPCTRLLLNFPPDFISKDIQCEILSLGHLHRNNSMRLKVNDIFKKIESEYDKNDFLSKSALKCYTEELCILLLRNKSEVKNLVNTHDIAEKAIKYIQENYTAPLKLFDVAKFFSVSGEHLSRAFKKKTSFGFNEYVTALRLKKAEYMLKNEPGRSVSDIAFSCGFNDSNYFSYKFKKLYGESPMQLRCKTKKI